MTRPYRAAWRGLLVLVMMLGAAETSVVEAEPVTENDDVGFHDLTVIGDDELQALRGGFEFAGLTFNFGANLRTFVDGILALETIISYTANGIVARHLPVSATNTPTKPGVTVAGISGSVQVLGGDQGPSPAELYLPNVDLSGMKDAAGVLIDDRRGAILALHEATRDRITSMVVNQAAGRDVRQEVDISVTIQNFRQFQDAMRGAILSGRIGSTHR